MPVSSLFSTCFVRTFPRYLVRTCLRYLRLSSYLLEYDRRYEPGARVSYGKKLGRGAREHEKTCFENHTPLDLRDTRQGDGHSGFG
jgi:hypothetical protein